jgi:hypothetical protein
MNKNRGHPPMPDNDFGSHNATISSPPNLRQLGEEMHARLLSGTSLTVTSEIAETFLPPVSNSLRKEFSSLKDPRLIGTANHGLQSCSGFAQILFDNP